jgi:hypothetical protein
MHLSRVILAGNPNGSMSAHMKGHEGNLPVKTQIQSLWMSGPLDGAPDAPTVGHPFCRFIPRSGFYRQLRPDSAGFAFEP